MNAVETRAFVVLAPTHSHPRARSLLGERWLSNRLAAARGGMRHNDLSPSGMGLSTGRLENVVVRELYFSSSSTDGRGETPLLDLLECNLIELADNLPPRVQSRLRDEHDATKVMYELLIAAGCSRLGWRLDWASEGPGKQPEMFATAGTGLSLSVECKKRHEQDGYEESADGFWKHFQHEMRPTMQQAQLNYWLKVTARDFRLADVTQLTHECAQLMSSQSWGGPTTLLERYQVEFQRLAAPGEAVPSEVLDSIPRGRFGVNGGEVPRDQVPNRAMPGKSFATGWVTDPKALRVELIDDPLHRIEGIRRNLKNAAKQVMPGAPSVVYIDSSFETHEQELAEFGSIVRAVRQDLNGGHEQISAVVLTNIYPARALDGSLGIRVRTAPVAHPRPDHALPNDTAMPGVSRELWIPGFWAYGA